MMKKWNNEYKLFSKYLYKYLILLIIIIISCIPMIASTYRLTSDNVNEVTTEKMEAGMQELESYLSKMYSMVTILNKDVYMNYLKNTDDTLPSDHFVYMTYLKKQMFNMNLMLDFAALDFVIYKDNPVIVTSNQVSDNINNYYGKFLKADDYNTKDFVDLLEEQQSGITFIRFNEFTYYKDPQVFSIEEPIAWVIKPYNKSIEDDSATLVFIIEKEKLVDLLLTNDLKEEGIITVKDATGQIILSYGKEDLNSSAGELGSEIINGVKYKIFTYKIDEYGITTTIGLPVSLIERKIGGIIDMLVVYVCIGLFLIIFLSLFLSYRQYIPMRNLLKVVSSGDVKSVSMKNEIDYIRQTVENIKSTNNEYKVKVELLNSQIHASMLERLFLQGIYTEEEYNDMKSYFDIPIEFFCVVIMHINTKDKGESMRISLKAEEFLRNIFKNNMINVHTGISDEIFMILLSPDDPSNVEYIVSLFEEMTNKVTIEENVDFNIGVSSIGKDMVNIHQCYNQAQQAMRAYYVENTNTVGSYSLVGGDSRNSIFNMELLQGLYNTLLSGERNKVEELFTKIISRCKVNTQDFELQRPQLFYSIRQIIYNACLASSIDSTEIEFPTLVLNEPAGAMIEALMNASFELCRLIENKRHSNNTALKDRILLFLEENYHDCNMSAAFVCEHIGISEKYLFQFIKEHTGKTFMTYIDELRIRRAKELLDDTTFSNAEIASQCGFGSIPSFYRVFNKYVGISPGIYRKNDSK